MSKPGTDLYDDLVFRGLIHQMSDPGLAPRLGQEPMSVYIGFDPSADSLQVGSLLQICNLRRMQDAGHRPLALAGGATGMIGDPGGKSEERNLLDADVLAANLEGIRAQLGRYLDFSPAAGPRRAVLLDNGEWLKSMGLIEFLRDVGKHFTVNQMIAKESVHTRLTTREQGISFTEFSYMLLQSYDFLHLYDTHDCLLQMGGSDQWGNITMGIDLIRRLRSGQAWGLTTPLVLKADGTKFGKSEAGTVWLDPARTSPYQLLQFFVRTEDAMVGSYLRYFTWLDRDRLAELDEAVAAHPESREAQWELARSVVSFVHGADQAARAEAAARVLFSEEISGLDEDLLVEVFSDVPSSDLDRAELDGPGLLIVDILARSGLVASKSAARTALAQGGVYVNNTRQTDPALSLDRSHLLHDRYIILRRGKREQHLLRFA
ncbi:MAG: tyrosine--tRNA ligase [Acidimicrobiales bacterium]